MRMDCAPTAAQRRWLYVPQTVTASRHMEVIQQSGALDPQAEPQLGGSPEPDVLDSNSHIWIIDETKFTYRTMVQRVNFQNAVCSFYLVKIIQLEVYHLVSLEIKTVISE